MEVWGPMVEFCIFIFQKVLSLNTLGWGKTKPNPVFSSVNLAQKEPQLGRENPSLAIDLCGCYVSPQILIAMKKKLVKTIRRK